MSPNKATIPDKVATSTPCNIVIICADTLRTAYLGVYETSGSRHPTWTASPVSRSTTRRGSMVPSK